MHSLKILPNFYINLYLSFKGLPKQLHLYRYFIDPAILCRAL